MAVNLPATCFTADLVPLNCFSVRFFGQDIDLLHFWDGV